MNFYQASVAWERSRMTENFSIADRETFRRVFNAIDEAVFNGWVGASINLHDHEFSNLNILNVSDRLKWLGYNVVLDGDGKIDGFHHVYVEWKPSVQRRVTSYSN